MKAPPEGGVALPPAGLGTSSAGMRQRLHALWRRLPLQRTYARVALQASMNHAAPLMALRHAGGVGAYKIHCGAAW